MEFSDDKIILNIFTKNAQFLNILWRQWGGGRGTVINFNSLGSIGWITWHFISLIFLRLTGYPYTCPFFYFVNNGFYFISESLDLEWVGINSCPISLWFVGQKFRLNLSISSFIKIKTKQLESRSNFSINEEKL